MAVENPAVFRAYVEKLSDVSGVSISRFADLLQALQVRHDFFASVGCKLSDHGIEAFYAEKYTQAEIDSIFNKMWGLRVKPAMTAADEAELADKAGLTDETALANEAALTALEISKFKSAMMYEFAKMDFESGWTQQFHYGVLRNNNERMFKKLGADTGFDSIGDFQVARALAAFLNRLDAEGKLAKTILYNINPGDNAMIATMIGNFQDGSIAGKIQFGSGWWFLDQMDGMQAQMNSLSTLGLLSRFVGMLTDSRSFISYPRHEYFRRILCNLIGSDVENGLLPSSELPFLGQLVENVSYYNAKNFFNF
jgi:glucuronate isomerase